MTDVHLRIYELYIDALVLVTVRTVSDTLHTVLTVQNVEINKDQYLKLTAALQEPTMAQWRLKLSSPRPKQTWTLPELPWHKLDQWKQTTS